jgi:hypothetical protein
MGALDLDTVCKAVGQVEAVLGIAAEIHCGRKDA